MTLRLALYSPGMVGLGHMRRNLLLARAFKTAFPDASVLMLTEAREACSFEFPHGVDCVSLPALRKSAEGIIEGRNLTEPVDDIRRLRSGVLSTALRSYRPHVLLVDHLPAGALGELGEVLPRLRRNGTRLVLGMRDIIEEPATVEREWHSTGAFEFVERTYDQVWIYGDRAVYDPVAEYSFSPVLAGMARFTGYLDPTRAHPVAPESVEVLAERILMEERMVLCTVGGGQDGLRVADAFAAADFPSDTHGILLSGPFMPPEARVRLRQHGRLRPRLDILDFISEPLALLRRSDAVISMGGYNSVCEALAIGRPTLVVPRALPRSEQRIRALRLAELGLVEVLESESLRADALSSWMHSVREGNSAPRLDVPIDLNGLDRATRLLGELIREIPLPSPSKAVA